MNVNTGDIAWEVPLGLTQAPPEGKRLTGSSGSAGPSVTAGDRARRRHVRLTAAGLRHEDRERLWSARVPRQANANPLTYRGKSGKDYIAAVATHSLSIRVAVGEW